MHTDKNWAEWTVFGVGAALVLATAGYLAYDAIAVEQTPPSLHVSLGDSIDAAEGLRVPVVVENKGTQAAQTVRVTVEARWGSGETDRAELVLEHVPGEAARRGAVVFPDRNVPVTLSPLPVSYETP